MNKYVVMYNLNYDEAFFAPELDDYISSIPKHDIFDTEEKAREYMQFLESNEYKVEVTDIKLYKAEEIL